MEPSASGLLASSREIRRECYACAGPPTTANHGASLLDGFEGTNGGLRPVELRGRCTRLVTCGQHRARSCTAIRRFPKAHRSSTARGFRFSRFSTIWQAVKRSRSSWISSRRFRNTKRSPLWRLHATPFWPARILLEENLPLALTLVSTARRIITLQADVGRARRTANRRGTGLPDSESSTHSHHSGSRSSRPD